MENLILKLCKIPGVSGNEGDVRAAILKEIAPHCTAETDNLGNIIAFKKGKNRPKSKVVFSAHMDEIGLIITYIDDSGYLKFAPVGGIDSRILVGKTVFIGQNQTTGVIGSKAVHQQTADERKALPESDKLFIDIGAKNQSEALAKVCLGDTAVFESHFLNLGSELLAAGALDDRAGCALLIELLKTEAEYDFYCAFTILEEVGCHGAVGVGNTLQPDIAVAVETTTASDVAGVAEDKQVCHLGKGPVLSFMDKGTVYDKPLYEFIMAEAKKEGISVQAKAGVFGGNESRSYQTAAGGAKTAAVSFAARYLHSPHCVINKKDIAPMLALLKHLTRTLPTL